MPDDNNAPYGYCPICRTKGVSRGSDGYDRCANDHPYVSTSSLNLKERNKFIGCSSGNYNAAHAGYMAEIRYLVQK